MDGSVLRGLGDAIGFLFKAVIVLALVVIGFITYI